ncbi:hypothetical protein N0V90_010255 [Kalmusia sp. IMI 367209]|nr:hypothetical protein N0V90_010255 [Kalmusia sp. IMI 367209]
MAPLDAATRKHVLGIIQRALEEDDPVSQALIATAGFPHLMAVQEYSNSKDEASIRRRSLVLMSTVLVGLAFIFIFMLTVLCWYISWAMRKRLLYKRYTLWRQGVEQQRWYEKYFFHTKHLSDPDPVDPDHPKFHMR